MNSRTRISQTFNHKQPDKVPIDCGGHRSSNFSIAAYRNLREYMGLKPDTLYVYDVIQQLVVPNDDILDHFNIDVVDLGRNFRNDESYWKDWEQHDGTIVKIPKFVDLRKEGNDIFMYNGSGRKTAVQRESCLYFEQLIFPRQDDVSDDFSGLEEQLHDIMWADVGAPPAPLGFTGGDMEKRKKAAKEIRNSTDRAIYGLFGGSLYETSQMTFRIDVAMINLIAEPKMMHDYLDKLTEIHIKNLTLYLEACGDEIDILGVGDDLGMQTGSQISPEMYREFFKGRHKQIWEHAKKLKPHLKLCMHSCGDIEPLLADIIDNGMDAVNPVQISCTGMDPKHLKEKFGKDIVFYGGGCDTRSVLPNGTPKEVKEHVKRNLDIFFKDGGYVFQQVHNIVSDVPPQNIVAMFEAIEEFSG